RLEHATVADLAAWADPDGAAAQIDVDVGAKARAVADLEHRVVARLGLDDHAGREADLAPEHDTQRAGLAGRLLRAGEQVGRADEDHALARGEVEPDAYPAHPRTSPRGPDGEPHTPPESEQLRKQPSHAREDKARRAAPIH